MNGWYPQRRPDGSARAVIAVTMLAFLLVAAVPVALVTGVVMMMLGHVVGGLALFGASVLAAAVAVVLAGMSGRRHLRKLLSGPGFGTVPLDDNLLIGNPEPRNGGYANVVHLDRSEYTEVR